MKLAVSLSLLSLVIGYLAGSVGSRDEVNAEAPVVVKSERASGGRASRSRERHVSESGRGKIERIVSEVSESHDDMTEIAKARLMKQILELEAADFPDVLGPLRSLSDSFRSDPFDSGSDATFFVTVALGRWYELEGESVLQWIASQPEVLKGRRTSRDISTLVIDRYRSDPQRSFELLKTYVVMGEDEKWSAGDWTYQIGRWSEEFAREVIELEELAKEYGLSFDEENPDPFADSDSDQWSSFIEGMIDAGREAEARSFLETQDPQLVAKLESELAEEKRQQIREKGWQAMKAAIERGELEGDWRSRDLVLEGWVKEDPEAALAWYLEQPASREEREDQIFTAVTSSEFFSPREGMRRKQFDAERVSQFLDGLDARGEPTTRSWDYVIEAMSENGRWNELMAFHEVAPVERRRLIENYVRDHATESGSIFFGDFSDDGLSYHFQRIQDGPLLSLFGLHELVKRELAAANERSFRRLRESLSVE